jgi:hypothetical protein
MIAKIIGLVVLVFVIALLFALPVMWLWNDLMPELFGLKTINFWKALELSLLCSALFKSSNSSSSEN